ncbi:MAG: metalloregulator ArsR/SmtB family transcription factor [Desulfovibrionaceae bacterium]
MEQNKDFIVAQAKIFKALGHPSRLLMVEALMQQEELCVCDLQSRVGADMSTISKHLGVLKAAGIVRDSKRGLNVYYSLQLKCLSTFMRCTADAIRGRLLEDMKLLGR